MQYKELIDILCKSNITFLSKNHVRVLNEILQPCIPCMLQYKELTLDIFYVKVIQ